MQLVFGAGDFFAVPLVDAQGNPINNPTPIQIGAMQEMSLDFSGDLKELYGQKQFALAVARGKVKTTGKFKGAQIHGAALNSLFFGTGYSSGSMHAINTDSSGVLVPSSPYTVTVTPPSSGTYVDDMGVLDANAVPMTRVASAPAAGQYMVNTATGLYTFASADVGKKVFINYRYSYSLTSAKRITLTNMAMGQAPAFKAYMQTTFQGKRALVILESVVSTKLQLLATKQDDFSVPSVDFSANADASGSTLGDIYVQE